MVTFHGEFNIRSNKKATKRVQLIFLLHRVPWLRSFFSTRAQKSACVESRSGLTLSHLKFEYMAAHRKIKTCFWLWAMCFKICEFGIVHENQEGSVILKNRSSFETTPFNRMSLFQNFPDSVLQFQQIKGSFYFGRWLVSTSFHELKSRKTRTYETIKPNQPNQINPTHF